ncbi:glycosyltransferase [Candidatus Haliotispira prima]|uniref:Glycosyltransferase n=1 Tax=Candidatus Haliotispira prima TaxID=3034016 RepID=A0ABY8MH33_9SPIO|nr:glycosyltransferase [Candidatus Haliotispira prima]
MKKIGIFFICTGRYTTFWRPFFVSAEQYFFSDKALYEKHYFVFTDQTENPCFADCERTWLIHIDKEAWPYPTLKRWHYFLQAEALWQGMDYLYFLNGTLRFTDSVGQEFLPSGTEPLCFMPHPCFSPENFAQHTYDRNPRSRAYIPEGEGRHYFMGGFHGGEREAYAELCVELRMRTDMDLEENIIALWHDESHLNRYALDYPERVRVLPYDSRPGIEDIQFPGRNPAAGILIQDKHLPQWGGHAWLRNELPNRITVRLAGGLGNQLWQYIAGLALYSCHARAPEPARLCVDTSWYANQTPGNDTPLRQFALSQLVPDIEVDNDVPEGILVGYPVYRESSGFCFADDFADLPPAVILEGYFQHYRYFEMAGAGLRLRLKPMDKKYRDLEQSRELAALHVWRGDLLSEFLSMVHGVQPTAYYAAAIRDLKEQVQNPYFLVFSDDLEWVKENLVPLLIAENLDYSLPSGSVIDDFSLMARCRHFIIANSSFSALAALLGQREGSVVFVPQMWHLSMNVKSGQFLPLGWQTLSYPCYIGEAITEPKVSVVVPVYNARKYLYRCLESICQQTEENLEIIVVDDASPDDSWELIREFAQMDSRLVSIRHEQNKHLGGARNTGIEAARGEWLLFVDSDDYIRKDTVKVFLEVATENPDVELLTCNIWSVSEDGAVSRYGDGISSVERIEQPLECYFLKGTIFPCAWAKLWKRDIWLRTGIRFPEHVTMEDFSTTPKLLADLGVALLLPDRLFGYQQQLNSIMSRYWDGKLKDYGAAFFRLHSWFESVKGRKLGLYSHSLNIYDDVLRIELYKGLDCCEEDLIEEELLRRIKLLIEHNIDMAGRYLRYTLRTLESTQTTLESVQGQIAELESNRWLRFGRLSRKRKLWVLGKVLGKKLGLYKLLRSIADLLRRL